MFRLLDLFCGAGGCAKGYQRAGFWVRGVDHKPQPRYVGNESVQADALEYLASLIQSGELAEFDAVHASPPCQANSSLRNLPTVRNKGHVDMIPETRELLQQCGLPFVIENVMGAPLESAPMFGVYRIMLCGTMFNLSTPCGAQLQRHRLFETNWEVMLDRSCQHGEAATIGVWGSRPRDAKAEREKYRGDTVIPVIGNGSPVGSRRRTITITGSTPQQNVVRNQIRDTFSVADAQVAMGIDWVGMAGLSQAIPPAYTEYIGLQLIEFLKR